MRESDNYINQYIFLRPRYKHLAEKISLVLKEILEIKEINFHYVSYRAKDIESFSRKAENPKYKDPLSEVTDLAGIRIIAYVEEDVNKICEIVRDLFDIDENNSLDKSTELGLDKVGYRSIHFVCQLKSDRSNLLEYSRIKELKFEIQVRTILQHSWAEIEHDKNYKFTGTLPSEIKRRFKLLAGTLEGADREFNSLSSEIDVYNKDVKAKTEKGDLVIELNTTSLNQFLLTKFNKGIDLNILIPGFNKKEVQILQELKSFGVDNLQDLDDIISPQIYQSIMNSKRRPLFTSFTGLLRTIMMGNNSKKYFKYAYSSLWTSFSSQSLEILAALGLSKDAMLNELKTANKRL